MGVSVARSGSPYRASCNRFSSGIVEDCPSRNPSVPAFVLYHFGSTYRIPFREKQKKKNEQQNRAFCLLLLPPLLLLKSSEWMRQADSYPSQIEMFDSERVLPMPVYRFERSV